MKTIFWDFDGVILDSMSVRDYGFEQIFKSYSENEINQLLTYHRENGGLSRYVKIEYFFNEILNQEITKDEVLKYASEFSIIMKDQLVNPSNIIQQTLVYIKQNHKNYNFHIVSGSDGEELRYLCKSLNLENYFISINGSPTPKNKLVKDILSYYEYNLETCCLIGDSINDYDAANHNNIDFFGFNNIDLKDLGSDYINNFSQFQF